MLWRWRAITRGCSEAVFLNTLTSHADISRRRRQGVINTLQSPLFSFHTIFTIERLFSRAASDDTPRTPPRLARIAALALFVWCFIHIADSIPLTHQHIHLSPPAPPSPPRPPRFRLRLRLRRASRPHSSRDRLPAHDPRLPRVMRIQTLGVHHCRRGLFTHPLVRARPPGTRGKVGTREARPRDKIIPQPPPPRRRVPNRQVAVSGDDASAASLSAPAFHSSRVSVHDAAESHTGGCCVRDVRGETDDNLEHLGCGSCLKKQNKFASSSGDQ